MDMKKLAIFLVLAMLLSIGVSAAPAQLGVEAVVEVPAAGETGTVTLTICVEEATAAGTVTVSYDNATLTYVSTSTQADLSSVKDTGSVVTLVYSNLEAKAGNLAEVTFAYDCTEGATTVVDVKAKLNGEEDATSDLSTTLTLDLPSEAEACPSAAFTDVNPARWYHEAVDFAVSSGLMEGMSKTIFAPNASTTRAQFVTIVSRAAGVDVSGYEGKTDFTDVSEDVWYAPYVAWAAEEGLVQGYGDGTFHPNASISRQEMVTILARFLGAGAGDVAVLEGFDDADQIAGWAQSSVAWAVENGIIRGYADCLDPRGDCTRAQTAQIFLNYENAN